jgi:proteasome-associated ATPase
VICRDFGRFDGKFLSTGNRPVEWDEIGGNEEAKQALREAIELPHTEGDLFAHYGKKPTSGIIFLGPPGCGKTLLARAAATSMARRYKMAGALKGFIYVKGPECKNMWYGNTEATVRALFGQARQFKEEHGFPAIICVDEADAIVRTRGTRGGLDVDDSTVNAFLAEMDGLEESGACMMLLTNRADTIDPAILRDGRIDRKITVKRPTREDAATIFMINLKKKPLLGGPSSLDRLVGDAADSLYSDKHVLLDLSRTGGGKVPFHLRNIASGALVAGIVEEAILLAMRRDRTAATKTGIGIDELLGAIEAKCAQNKAIDHSEAIADFAKSLQPEAQHAAQ